MACFIMLSIVINDYESNLEAKGEKENYRFLGFLREGLNNHTTNQASTIPGVSKYKKSKLPGSPSLSNIP